MQETTQVATENQIGNWLGNDLPLGKETVVAISGYFDPLHVGHLKIMKEAKKLGDRLIVIVNNDKQAKLKKGKSFMPEDERIEIVNALNCVDFVVKCIDTDRTVCKTLERLKPHIFANGGDRTEKNIPELDVCEQNGIDAFFGIGGDKLQSSSVLLKNYCEYFNNR